HTRFSRDWSSDVCSSDLLFFGTMSHFVELFSIGSDPEQIKIDFSHSHVWDQSAVRGIAQVVAKYRQLGKHAEVIGLNEESRLMRSEERRVGKEWRDGEGS